MVRVRAFGPLAVGLAALCVAAAGCGSSAKSTSSTTSTTSTTATRAGLAAFQSCLAQHGVKLRGGFGSGRPPAGGQRPSGSQPPSGQPPTGQGGAPGLSAAQRSAFSACQSKLPAGQRGGFGRRPSSTTTNPALAKYTACLKSHGVTFGKTNNQATFKKASAACAKYAPTAGG